MTTPKTTIRSFRDLLAWQRGIELSLETYLRTESYPKREMYGIVAQMRRATISIPANIAEGYARQGMGDYLRFLGIALGSLRELQTYAELSCHLGFSNASELARLHQLADETARLLSRLAAALRKRKANRAS